MSVPQISALARIAEETRPDDPEMQAALLLRIQELGKLMREARAVDLAACLDAAAALVSHLAEGGTPTAADVHRATLEILHAVEGAFTDSRPDPFEEPPAAVPAAAEPKRNVARLAEQPNATPLLNDMLLGRILMEFGHVDEERLHKALEFQRLGGGRIGDILVRTGAVAREEIEAAARIQAELRRQAEAERNARGSKADSSPSLRLVEVREEERPGAHTYKRRTNGYLLGQILVQMGALRQKDVDAALVEARASGQRIGEVLVRNGVVDWDTVHRAQLAQVQLRRLAGYEAPARSAG